MAQTGVNPQAAADLLRQAMAQKYVQIFSTKVLRIRRTLEWVAIHGGAILFLGLGHEERQLLHLASFHHCSYKFVPSPPMFGFWVKASFWIYNLAFLLGEHHV